MLLHVFNNFIGFNKFTLRKGFSTHHIYIHPVRNVSHKSEYSCYITLQPGTFKIRTFPEEPFYEKKKRCITHYNENRGGYIPRLQRKQCCMRDITFVPSMWCCCFYC